MLCPSSSHQSHITYLAIFAALLVFLAIRPNGLMGKPWG
jgi:branched-chain amino acid transport system permease protein